MSDCQYTRAEINTLWTRLMIEELIAHGVHTFCLAPGSRCAPLAVAVAKNSKANAIHHYDERGLAFFALGYARATGKAAVVITTSGTAAVNVFPALVEAHQDEVPMLVLTADRPPELRGTEANQTINQVHLFGSYPVWFLDVSCPDDQHDIQDIIPIIHEALKHTLRGPVHLNCMFRKPLVANELRTAKNLKREKNFFSIEVPRKLIFPDVSGLPDNGLVVAGQLFSEEDRKEVLTFSEQSGYPIFPDITSGLRLGTDHPNIIHYADQILLDSDFPVPKNIIKVGGRIVSKRIQALLQKKSSREDFMSLPELRDLSEAENNRIEKIIGDDALTEPLLARRISELIPENHTMFLGNSMPIRDMDMYAVKGGAPVPVYANRGASGIDGLIASASGVAFGTKKGTTLLLGDLSFLHDLNSLAFLMLKDFFVVLVVINNDGGGIFSLLPIAEHTDIFENYFGLPHGLRFKRAAELFGLQYYAPSSIHDFSNIYTLAIRKECSCLIEVRTNRAENAELHQKLSCE